MERQLGHDFSRVRVHADGPAADSARGVRALAYTVGPHIVFGAGRYSPDSAPGQRLLAHELTHVMQQGAQPWSPSSAAELTVSSPGDATEREADRVATQSTHHPGPPASVPRSRAGAGVLHRTWDPLLPGECTAHPEGVWLQKVVVDQEKAQSVTLHWSDSTVTSSICSTGKGHCCVDDTDPGGTAASVSESRRNGSNATPIGTGFVITDRHRRNGWPFWNVFEPSRAIALHQHHTVTGTPLSHGCVRLPEQTAHEIFCGSRQNRTQVEVRGFSRPSCDEPELRHEWLQDFRTAGREVSDGERPDTARIIRENRAESRRILTEAYGHKPTEAEIAQGMEDQFTIPRCGFHGAEPTAEERRAVPETGAGANVASTSSELLARSGLERFVPATSRALEAARSLSAARTALQRLGRDLRSAANVLARGGQGNDQALVLGATGDGARDSPVGATVSPDLGTAGQPDRGVRLRDAGTVEGTLHGTAVTRYR